MTISSTTRRAGPFLGNDATTTFSFEFKVFTKNDVLVTLTAADGVDSTLTVDSDYSVTLNADQDNDPGGEITYPISGSPLATGEKLTLSGSLPNTQTADITNAGGFYPEVLEAALDRTVIQVQQLAEENDRAVKAPVSEEAGNLTMPGVSRRAGRVLAFEEGTGDPMGGPLIESVGTVAGAVANIDTVAGSIDDVNTVADAISNVNTVAAGIDNVNTVASISSEVETVAGISADVTTVAENVTDVTNFASVYLGPATSDPLTRTDGSALQQGDLYFNTISGAMQVYGTGWSDVAKGVSTPFNIFDGDGTQDEFVLSGVPGSLGSVEVYLSGARLTPGNDYTVNTDTVTFSSAPPSGTDNILVRWLSTQEINVPSDGSVTLEKMAVESLDSANHAYNNSETGLPDNVQDAIDAIALKTGQLINIQYFTSSGSYTPTAGTKKVLVEVVGGGGGGGAGNIDNSFGGGGAGGGYSRKMIDVSTLTVPETITIGAGGGAGISGGGSPGGTTSFGGHVSANGGAAGASASGAGYAAGGSGVGGDMNITGGTGDWAGSVATHTSGRGGCAAFYCNVSPGSVIGSGGVAGNGYGAGGGGGGRSTGTTRAGADGTAGLCVVWEYA